MASKRLIALFVISLGTFNAAHAEPICPKCEVIREYNEKNPGDYEYYEDYQKNLKEKPNQSNIPKHIE